MTLSSPSRSQWPYAAGSNSGGQLGIGGVDDVHRFQPCRFEGSSSGLPDGARILQLASGANHTLVLVELSRQIPTAGEPSKLQRTSFTGQGSQSTTKQVWAAGHNVRGQLGRSLDSTDDPRVFHRLDIDDLVASSPLGRASHHDHSSDSILEPIRVAASWETSFIVLRPRSSHGSDTADPLSDAIFSFGSNDFGELGAGLPVGRVDMGPHLVDLYSVVPHSSPSDRVWFRVEDIVAGPRHALAVLIVTGVNGDASTRDDERVIVVGWGAARHGQLGPLEGERGEPGGGDNARTKPSSLKARPVGRPMASKRRGPSGDGQGAVVSPRLINFPSRSRPSSDSFLPTSRPTSDSSLAPPSSNISIAAGRDHTALLYADLDRMPGRHKVYTMGSDKKGQLAHAFLDSINLAAESASCSAVSRADSAGTVDAGDLWPLRVHCSWNSTFLLCRSSLSHGASVSREADTRVYAWGSNQHGQLGNGYGQTSNAQPSSSTPASVALPWLVPTGAAVTPDDRDNHGDRRGREIIKLAAGSEHVLLLVRVSSSAPRCKTEEGDEEEDETEVWAWGWNEHGNLGLGHKKDVYAPTKIWPPVRGPLGEQAARDVERGRVVDVWAGCGTSWVVVEQ